MSVRLSKTLRRGAYARAAGAAFTLLLFIGLLVGRARAAWTVSSTVLYAQEPCTPVYAAASKQSTLLTQLLGGTDVTALGQAGTSGASFEHVQVWSGVDGYIPSGILGPRPPKEASESVCTFPGVPDAEADVLPVERGPWALAGRGILTMPATLFSAPTTAALPTAGLPQDMAISVTGWASDASGYPWYEVRTSIGSGWVWSGAVRLDAPNPATRFVDGHPIWSPVAGKGMWFTNYFPHHSDMSAVVQAAKLAGITHLYAEVAITQYGFYGRNTLDRLLPVAHAAGISVIAWVYPTLSDITADVRMTAEVAAYATPTGDRADGIATDVEEVDDSASVLSYGQLLRALVGPDLLLVAAVYHPYAETYYPYAAIAASWNVIAPMDYWHSRPHHQYTAADVGRFVTNSITTVRAAMHALGGNALPVEELGQTYDMYTEDGTGASDAPTDAEITADMQAARGLGCIGVSFFEWQTATQGEWAAITRFHW